MSESIQSRRSTIFSALFCGYEGPAFAIRLWDGWRWSSSNSEKPVCTMVVSDSNAFSAELTLVQAELNERLTLVQLYNSLGGWQP
jgi:hypothetical protein